MTTKAVDVMAVVADFFEESGLDWNKLEGVCTDGGPNMLGSRSGFITLVKQKQPDLKGTHCMIHREALASKTVPKNLHDALTVIINIVNYVKGSALNTRLFRELCRDMDANHTALLFHTQVRWLSKGNMLARVFELREETKLFLIYSNKVDLLSAFNKELQEQRSNVIVHTDTINAFMVDDVPEDMQNEFLELKHNSSTKDEFRAQDLEEF
ncbi:protein ZBED8-like [Portunus trituberculatus]|uniref:protein ZBED8-like n=1 Tax=Portunus trituberculatus TaxID=210409 RepID=UPI001E1CB7C4|nr:protein ZBED8-like [Portunus trituberculatus]